ncbi:MAG: hypothetical protein ACLTKG_08840 [Collinsella intestinalis]
MCPIETPEGPNIGLIGSLAWPVQVRLHRDSTARSRTVSPQPDRLDDRR